MGSAVHIYGPTRSSDDIYGTTIHEIAHASHWNMNRSNYKNGEKIVVESWATGVEWALTKMVYSNYDLASRYSRLRYTGIVQDLMDGNKTVTTYYYYDVNTSQILSGPYRSYEDRTSGYTIREIEDALNGNRTWEGWSNALQLSPNPTRQYVSEGFNYWNTF